jgi:hypothetical protein
MNSADHLRTQASRLRQAARDFHELAARPGASAATPAALESLEEALQAIGTGWFELAADAVPGVARRQSSEPVASPERRGSGLSREREVQLAATLHELAGGFARCARGCREARSIAEPLIAAQPSSHRPVRHAGMPAWPGRRRLGAPSPRGDWR